MFKLGFAVIIILELGFIEYDLARWMLGYGSYRNPILEIFAGVFLLAVLFWWGWSLWHNRGKEATGSTYSVPLQYHGTNTHRSVRDAAMSFSEDYWYGQPTGRH